MTGAQLQSALQPAGIQAARIEWLWWVILSICVVVFVAVLAFVAVPVIRALRGRVSTGGKLPLPGAQGDGSFPQVGTRPMIAVAFATALTVVIMIGLLIVSMITGRALQELDPSNNLSITVTGNQWWWNIEYDAPVPSERVRTANELHLPVGRVVRLTLASNDVIHSFWVPTLQGKIDLIPGRRNFMHLRADQPGVYRGQCAEYCGLQHAHMAIVVFVEPEDGFNAWLTAQRQPAKATVTEAEARGKELFDRGSCALCHAVAGTIAGGRTGPDLTHVASRATLAAGTIPNRRDELIRWLRDPHQVKPGNKMPAPGLNDAEIQALVAYLESLK